MSNRPKVQQTQDTSDRTSNKLNVQQTWHQTEAKYPTDQHTNVQQTQHLLDLTCNRTSNLLFTSNHFERDAIKKRIHNNIKLGGLYSCIHVHILYNCPPAQKLTLLCGLCVRGCEVKNCPMPGNKFILNVTSLMGCFPSSLAEFTSV